MIFTAKGGDFTYSQEACRIMQKGRKMRMIATLPKQQGFTHLMFKGMCHIS